jgi:hypothetical protein
VGALPLLCEDRAVLFGYSHVKARWAVAEMGDAESIAA